MSSISRVGLLFVVAYVAFIILANYLIATFPPIPVWPFPLLYAPAGVLAAGLCMSTRNAVQQTMGRRWGFGAILVGAGLSYFVSAGVTLPGGVVPLSVASGLAFLFSETTDALVWTKLRERRWWVRAMFLGDLAGQATDSVLFLLLSFGSLDFLAGQVIGKQWTIWPVIGLMALFRWHRSAALDFVRTLLMPSLKRNVRIVGK